MTETALIAIEKLDPIKVFTDKKSLDEILAELKRRALDFEADVSTKKGRDAIASQAYKVARSKTVMDNLGKELVADWKKKAGLVDGSRKYVRDFCDDLKDTVRKELTEWEAEEAAREEREIAEAEFAKAWDEGHAEHDLYLRQKAIEAKEAEMTRIEAEKRAKEEAERIERERIEREARIARETEERVKQEAREAIERAERERIAAIERAKIEAEQAEQRRIQAEQKAKEDQERAAREAQEAERRRVEQEKREKEAREAAEKAEAERKAANKNHQAKLNREAKESLMKEVGIADKTAEAIVIAIARGKILNVTINY